MWIDVEMKKKKKDEEKIWATTTSIRVDVKISHLEKEKVGKNTTIPLRDILLVLRLRKICFLSQLTNDYPCYFEFSFSSQGLKEKSNSNMGDETRRIVCIGRINSR